MQTRLLDRYVFVRLYNFAWLSLAPMPPEADLSSNGLTRVQIGFSGPSGGVPRPCTCGKRAEEQKPTPIYYPNIENDIPSSLPARRCRVYHPLFFQKLCVQPFRRSWSDTRQSRNRSLRHLTKLADHESSAIQLSYFTLFCLVRTKILTAAVIPAVPAPLDTRTSMIIQNC